MNHTRIHVYNRLRRENLCDQKQARRFKHYWRLFLKPFEDLFNRSYYEGRYFKREVTSKTILNLMLEYDDELSATHQYIQESIRCYHLHKVHRFLELLHKKLPEVSHYTNHRCHNLLGVGQVFVGLLLLFQMDKPKVLITGLNSLIALLLAIVTSRLLKLAFT